MTEKVIIQGIPQAYQMWCVIVSILEFPNIQQIYIHTPVTIKTLKMCTINQ